MELARLFALVTLREPQSRINVLALPTLPTTPLQVMDLTAGPPAMSPCCWPSYSHLPPPHLQVMERRGPGDISLLAQLPTAMCPPPSAGDGAQGPW